MLKNSVNVKKNAVNVKKCYSMTSFMNTFTIKI